MSHIPPIEQRYSRNLRVPTSSLSMDLTKVAAIVLGVGAATFTLAQSYFKIEQQIDNLSRDVSALGKSVRALDGRIVGKTPEGYHRRDAAENNEALCRVVANAVGKPVRCPDPYNLPGFRARQRVKN